MEEAGPAVLEQPVFDNNHDEKHEASRDEVAAAPPGASEQAEDGGGTTPSWVVEELICPVVASLTDDTIIEFNLAPTVGRWGQFKDGRKFYLPSFYNKNDPDFRREHLGPLFKDICAKAGFSVHMGWEAKENKTIFSCIGGHGNNHQHNEDLEKCRFRFLAYWDDKFSRWYLKEFAGGNPCHNGHSPTNLSDKKEKDRREEEPGYYVLVDEEEGDAIHEMLCRGQAFSALKPLVEDIACLIETPEHFVHFRDMLLRYKDQHLKRHRLVDTKEMEKNGKLKPRRKRSLCVVCKDGMPISSCVKTKTSKLCQACNVYICSNPKCLLKHRDQVVTFRRGLMLEGIHDPPMNQGKSVDSAAADVPQTPETQQKPDSKRKSKPVKLSVYELSDKKRRTEKDGKATKTGEIEAKTKSNTVPSTKKKKANPAIKKIFVPEETMEFLV